MNMRLTSTTASALANQKLQDGSNAATAGLNKAIGSASDALQPTKGQSKTASDANAFLLDRNWTKNAFLLKDAKLGDPKDLQTKTDLLNRYWSSAANKFTDTRLGGNIGINSRPQFTRYADIRVKGRLAGRNDVTLSATNGNFGMGRYYSEAIDDPSQTVFLRFGVPQFNSLTNFLTGAYDPSQIALARTGRATSVFYTLGSFAGTLAAVVTFPAASIAIMSGKMIQYFFIRQTSKFYTLKPTMHLYWSTVNNLVNVLAVNRGILPKIMNPAEEEHKLGRTYKIDQSLMDQIHLLMPDVFNGQNFFDMYALANRAQRLANQLFREDYDRLDSGVESDFTGYLKKDGQSTHPSELTDKHGDARISTFMRRITEFGNYYTNNNEKGDDKNRLELDPRINPNANSPDDPNNKDRINMQTTTDDVGFFNYFDAEFNDGSQFAAFKVEHTGAVSESFGNAVMDSDLSQKLNGISSQSREARFSFADGNVVGGEKVNAALGAAKDVVMGALDGLTLGFSSFLAGLGGSGYIDIPKHWQSSTASLPKTSYAMQLISPYGNAISQMQNIYIPLAMILAGGLPLSTGKQSYTSPFLCQIFDRGRCQIRLGMIESISVSRGTSNLAFDLQGHAMAIDVSFTVTDLSSIMHMPISIGVLSETIGSVFAPDMTLDEDNILSDYLAVLAGMDLYTQTYPMAKAKLTLAKRIASTSKLTSPAYWASLFHESSTSGMLKYLTLGAFNVLEAGAPGATGTVGQGQN